MSQKQLTDFTDEELIQEERKRKSWYTSYIIIVAFMIAAGVYNTIENGFGAFSILPLAFLSIIVALYNNYKAVKNEIASRKTNRQMDTRSNE